MKKTLFAIVFLLGMLIASESSAQRYRHHRGYRYSPPRMRLYTAPRYIVPPLLGLGLNLGRAGIYIAPPPIYLGRGLGWRHYHRRGMRCNDRCCRRENEYRRGYDRRYDYDRRNDRYDRRFNQNRDEEENIDTDLDIYEEVENDTY